MKTPRILIIEDESAIADTILYALATDGMTAEHCALGGEGLARLRAASFDLVILDVGLPDVNGFEACRTLRTFSDVPVIFLTARHEEIDRIVGLEIGADDYVVKPFSPRELAARVRVILRRASGRSVAPSPRRHRSRPHRPRSCTMPQVPAWLTAATGWTSHATNTGCWRCCCGIRDASTRARS
ncbi:hypothetical protein MAFF241647_34860 [Ralstonia solanacearum]|nr:hypothetical protein MAFF241647_34860 [Ralstonia solanacearum]